MPVTTIIVNAALFQCAWFACVLGAAHGLPWVGVFAVALAVAWHLARAARPLPELALVGVALMIGAAFETLLVQSGWLGFNTGILVAGTAPVWMVALWANFATTLNVSLRMLRDWPALSALVGGIGAPVAYYAGGALGALELREPGPALAAIAAGWLVLTPLLFAAARRLDGYATR
jgi:Protein of unknown function (DUF2878)